MCGKKGRSLRGSWFFLFREMGVVPAFLGIILACALPLPSLAEPDERERESVRAWEEQIRKQVFSDRPIREGVGQDIIQIKVPYRAEDAAVVPISVRSQIPQTSERYIRNLYIFIDLNPVPLVGKFEFSPLNGRADLAMRVRVDYFSYVRAVAELNNGELYMDKSYIRTAGGCSAPPGQSLAESLKQLGKMRIRQPGAWKPSEPGLVQLQIKHPNITGMAIDPRTNSKPPPYFLNGFQVSYDGAPVMKGVLTFGVSQDPSFRFFIDPPQPGGTLEVTASDTKAKEFSFSHQLSHEEGLAQKAASDSP